MAASCMRLPYFFLLEGESGEIGRPELLAWEGSCNELSLDRFGVFTDRFRQTKGASDPTRGEGRGVRSLMAARYGEGNADADPGEREDVRLEVDKFERKEEPMVGRVGLMVGSAAEDSYMMVGVSVGRVAAECRSVFSDRPALAGDAWCVLR